MIKRIKLWNIWRKRNLNSKLYKLFVLLGFIKSPTFRMELLPELRCRYERRHAMSYISDYEHGGDPFEYEQCCAEENRKDRIEREEYYREEEDDERE